MDCGQTLLQRFLTEGTMLLRSGSAGQALLCFQSAQSIDPLHALAYHYAGTAQHELGKFHEAVVCYEKALQINPLLAEAHNNRGNSLMALGRFDEAVDSFSRAAALLPHSPVPLTARATALQTLGRLAEAEVDCRKALTLEHDFAPAHRNLTLNLLLRENLKNKKDQLDRLLRQAYTLQPSDPESAEHLFRWAEVIAPDMPDILCGLAQLRAMAGIHDEAIDYYRRALTADPNYYQCLLGLGVVLQSAERFEEAEECYKLALKVKPGYLQALNNLGALLRCTGKPDEALEQYDSLVKLRPDYADARYNRSLVLLQLGRFREGWPEYEWRFLKTEPETRRHAGMPCWEGQSLSGKRILIHAEQGYGDTIQFVRYAKLLAEHGAEVLVEAQDQSIASLLKHVDGVHSVIVRGENGETADYQLPLMSLPLTFGTDLHDIPGDAPYIRASESKIVAWQQHMLVRTPGKDERMKIGLVWSGRQDRRSDRHRSIPFDLVTSLLGDENFIWYSLQVGEPEAQHPNLIDMTHKIHDFSDTAALIGNLDLVITIDTAVAHLAGALGKPVWVMLKFSSDWRWLLERSDSPWYPTMRLFRQIRSGKWENVVEEVQANLKTVCPV